MKLLKTLSKAFTNIRFISYSIISLYIYTIRTNRKQHTPVSLEKTKQKRSFTKMTLQGGFSSKRPTLSEKLQITGRNKMKENNNQKGRVRFSTYMNQHSEAKKNVRAEGSTTWKRAFTPKTKNKSRKTEYISFKWHLSPVPPLIRSPKKQTTSIHNKKRKTYTRQQQRPRKNFDYPNYLISSPNHGNIKR